MKKKGVYTLQYPLTTWYLWVVMLLLVMPTGCKWDNAETESAFSGDGYAKIPEKVDFTFHVKPIISD
ncbi:MAG: hypothetical protein HKP42_03595, partial [Maribacter sp.]|nr:hypothetical protein [Maribacter sp.]